MTQSVDVSHKPSPYSKMNRIMRVLWALVYQVFFRFSPRPMYGWRRFWLKLFGAKLGRKAKVFGSTKIWAPWNLEMEDYSTLAQDVICYSADKIHIGANSTVSQYSYLCGASHDYTHPNMLLYTKPIHIGSSVWVCADVFVGPGVTIHDGAVVGARSSVYSDLPEWMVCTGNPAKPLKKRILKQVWPLNST